jgi:hypothetical protein
MCRKHHAMKDIWEFSDNSTSAQRRQELENDTKTYTRKQEGQIRDTQVASDCHQVVRAQDDFSGVTQIILRSVEGIYIYKTAIQQLSTFIQSRIYNHKRRRT